MVRFLSCPHQDKHSPCRIIDRYLVHYRATFMLRGQKGNETVDPAEYLPHVLDLIRSYSSPHCLVASIQPCCCRSECHGWHPDCHVIPGGRAQSALSHEPVQSLSCRSHKRLLESKFRLVVEQAFREGLSPAHEHPRSV